MAAATAMTAARFSWSKRQPLTRKERVDRALRGEEVDRPPFTFWRHYNRSNAQLEAQDHLDLHRHGNEIAWWANLQIAPTEVARDLWQTMLRNRDQSILSNALPQPSAGDKHAADPRCK